MQIPGKVAVDYGLPEDPVMFPAAAAGREFSDCFFGKCSKKQVASGEDGLPRGQGRGS